MSDPRTLLQTHFLARRTLLRNTMILAGTISVPPKVVGADSGVVVAAHESDWRTLDATTAHRLQAIADATLPLQGSLADVQPVVLLDRHLGSYHNDAITTVNAAAAMLDLMPKLFGFGWSTMRRLPLHQRKQYINAVAGHNWYEVRNVAKLLVSLLQMQFYTDPRVERAIGYSPRCNTTARAI